MNHSSFVLNDDVRQRLANGQMQVADGRGGFYAADAPLFELATVPAGNLYTTAEDLARFAMMLCGEGRAGEQQILRPETLQQMFQSQAPQDRLSYGLGFVIGKFREHDTVGHMGAVYGFTSSLLVVPKHKLGVVVLANDDVIAGTVTKLAEAAMDLLLHLKFGEPLREEEKVARLSIEELAGLRRRLRIGELLGADRSPRRPALGECFRAGVRGDARRRRPVLGRWPQRPPTSRGTSSGTPPGEVQGFTALFQHFVRVDPAAVTEIPAAWKDFLGSYGPKFIPLVISVKHGHLYAMTENMFDYRLTPLNRTSFHLPMGMYLGEQLVFNRGEDGRVYAATLANMVLKRMTSIGTCRELTSCGTRDDGTRRVPITETRCDYSTRRYQVSADDLLLRSAKSRPPLRRRKPIAPIWTGSTTSIKATRCRSSRCGPSSRAC